MAEARSDRRRQGTGPSDPVYWGPDSPGAYALAYVRRVRRRIRALLFVRFGALGVAAVAGILAASVLWLRLNDAWYDPGVPWVALAGVLGAAALVCLAWPLPDRPVARHADRRLALKDRLSTVVGLSHRRSLSSMERAAIVDAGSTAAQTDIDDGYAFRWTRVTMVATVCVLALALVQTLPIPPLLMSDQDQRERAELARRASLMKPDAERLALAAKKAGDAEALELAKRLRQLARDFERGKYTKKEGLLAHKALQEKLNAHAEKLREAAPKTGRDAAKQLAKSLRKRMSAQAEKMAEEAAKQGKAEAQKRLQDLARKLEQAGTPEELKRLGSALQKAGKERNMEMPLSAAATAELTESLAGDRLEQALEKLEQMQEQIQKGLGEMSPDELKTLAEQLRDLAEALGDTELAEVADALEQAAKCMESGDREGAAKALREAQAAAQSAAARMGVARQCDEAGG